MRGDIADALARIAADAPSIDPAADGEQEELALEETEA
jgi:hypothetical protein